jgi:hypothetical protein
MSQKILTRLESLINEALEIQKMEHTEYSQFSGNYSKLGDEGDALFLEWKIKSKNILGMACNDRAPHLEDFKKAEEMQSFDTNAYVLKRLLPILKAAYDDLKSGFLVSFRQIVQAEVFDDEIEQAKELFNSGYIAAAAVIAGVVLETAVREICNNNRINTDRMKLDTMNTELVKVGFYNKLQQKQITTLADIRNSAAHGKNDQFEKADVQNMIRDIEGFLIKYLS